MDNKDLTARYKVFWFDEHSYLVDILPSNYKIFSKGLHLLNGKAQGVLLSDSELKLVVENKKDNTKFGVLGALIGISLSSVGRAMPIIYLTPILVIFINVLLMIFCVLLLRVIYTHKNYGYKLNLDILIKMKSSLTYSEKISAFILPIFGMILMSISTLLFLLFVIDGGVSFDAFIFQPLLFFIGVLFLPYTNYKYFEIKHLSEK